MDKESNNGEDRLSDLPDDIRCHILSFLDTKYAVATSVLSTRWKNLCFAGPNIDICPKTRKVTLPAEVFAPRLKITGRFDLDFQESVCLPNLKVLHLAYVRFANYDCMRRLFGGCKLLEDLLLSRCRTSSKHLGVVDLSHPSLRKLVIKDMLDVSKLVIDTPKLAFFEYRGREVEFQLVNELKCIHTAKISFISMKDPGNLYKLINKMHGVKSLYLSKVVYSRWYSLPVLEHLTRLELCFFEFQALSSILESTPQLEELVIPCPKRYGSVAEARELSSLQKNVPMCLVKHLKDIVFDIESFRTHEFAREFELLKFFLQKGKVLKRVKINILVDNEKLIPRYEELIRRCEEHIRR